MHLMHVHCVARWTVNPFNQQPIDRLVMGHVMPRRGISKCGSRSMRKVRDRLLADRRASLIPFLEEIRMTLAATPCETAGVADLVSVHPSLGDS
ncbi:MAG: hypothetical protein CMJ32_03900 [Phycisphaerae bacterium]|nr:hypothetical protein [Phycisphaerae bacterium]